MFSDLAVAHGVPVRRWTALASFSLQTAMVAVALVYPLFRLESLPTVPHPISLPLISNAAPVHSAENVVRGGAGRITTPIIVSNPGISFRPAANPSQEGDIAEPPNIDGGIYGSNVTAGPLIGTYLPPMPTVAHHEQIVRTSMMMEGNLIHKVEPQYPSIAKQLHVEGSVLIRAWISRDGLIERAQVESGHPLLAHAALEAVRQWRYRPYYLNHEPVEVETEVTVNFVLQR